jgi:hypothetical protein
MKPAAPVFPCVHASCSRPLFPFSAASARRFRAPRDHRFTSHRGEATLALVLILGIAGAFGYGAHQVRKTFEPGRPTKETDALAQRAQEAEAAAKDAQEKLAAAIKAHDDAVAAAQAKEKAAAGFIAGTGIALGNELNPSVNVEIAKKLNTDAANTLQAATPDQIKEFAAIIRDLTERNATTSAALAAKEAEAARLKVEATAAQKAAAAADAKATEAAQKNVTLSADVSQKASALKAWADNHQTLVGRLKAIAIVLALLWLASLILPLLGKFFPAFQPLATAFGAIWSPGVQVAASSARTLSADLVALNEHIKSELAKELTPEQVAALKGKIKDWWGNDQKSQAVVEDIKERILRA